jgi:hypothetical protein
MLPRPALLIATLLIAALAGGLLYETAYAPAGCCGLTYPQPDPVQAERLLAVRDPRGLDAAAQQAAALDGVRARPAAAGAWLRLAYADRLKHGSLSLVGRRAVETSYAVLPYAGAGAPWRLAFALDNWTAIGQAARLAAVREMDLAQADPKTWAAARKAAEAVRDPSGRAAAALGGLI